MVYDRVEILALPEWYLKSAKSGKVIQKQGNQVLTLVTAGNSDEICRSLNALGQTNSPSLGAGHSLTGCFSSGHACEKIR
jgi:hypothetical protein